MDALDLMGLCVVLVAVCAFFFLVAMFQLLALLNFYRVVNELQAERIRELLDQAEAHGGRGDQTLAGGSS